MKVVSTSPVMLILSLLLCSIVMCLHAFVYLPFLCDDALISLQYAKRLLAGNGLTWTDGAMRVEGYSNLLWVLLCAAIGSFGVELIAASKILGLLCGLGTLVALHAMFRASLAAAFLSSMALASSGIVVAWTMGGLEQPLVMLLLAWGWWYFQRGLEPQRWQTALIFSGILFGLLCLTRPDGPLFVAPLIAALWIRTGADRMVRVALFCAAPVIAVVTQLLFRMWYYGEWLPNTARIKISLTTGYFDTGLFYLQQGFLSQMPLLLLAAASAWIVFRSSPRSSGTHDFFALYVLGALLTLWAAYVVAIGGDVNAPFRHFVPIALFLSIIFGIGIKRLSLAFGRRQKIALLTCASSVLLIFFVLQITDDENRAARNDRGVYQGLRTANMLSEIFPDCRLLLAADQAGWPAYFTCYHMIDMLGLNDKFIASTPPANHGKGWIAHEFGNAEYVFEREPDLIIFGGPRGGERAPFPGGIEMQTQQRFFDEYHLVTIAPPAPQKERFIWMRTASPIVGMRKMNDTLIIPSQMLSSLPEGSNSRLHFEPSGANPLHWTIAPGEVLRSPVLPELEGADYELTVWGSQKEDVTQHFAILEKTSDVGPKLHLRSTADTTVQISEMRLVISDRHWNSQE